MRGSTVIVGNSTSSCKNGLLLSRKPTREPNLSRQYDPRNLQYTLVSRNSNKSPLNNRQSLQCQSCHLIVFLGNPQPHCRSLLKVCPSKTNPAFRFASQKPIPPLSKYLKPKQIRLLVQIIANIPKAAPWHWELFLQLPTEGMRSFTLSIVDSCAVCWVVSAANAMASYSSGTDG